MTVKIYVNENRTFSGAGRGFSLGTTFENDVTTLKFVTPESLSYLTNRYLLVEIGSDILKLPLNEDNEVVIGNEITTDENVRIQLVLTDDKGDMWRSVTYDVTFYESLGEANTKPSAAEQVKAAQEAYRKQLAKAVSAFSEEDHDADPFDDLTAYIAASEALKGETLVINKVYAENRDYTPSQGKNAYTKVTQEALKRRELSVRYNGDYMPDLSTDPDAEAGYYTHIYVNVKPYLVDLTVTPKTEDATYWAADSDNLSADGIRNVTVKAVTAAIDPNIKPENIITGVTILGVTGSATGGGGSSAEEFNYLLNGLENIFTTEVSA